MFHKPGSSTHSRGKKCKDVALRKSERRLLRRTVDTCLAPAAALQEGSETSVCKPAVDPLTNEILDAMFLQGSLLARTIDLHHATPSSPNGPRLTACTLYYREPDTHTPLGSSGVATENKFIWPYARHTQCVWIQLTEEPQHVLGSSGRDGNRNHHPRPATATLPKQLVHDLPGLALLSVLPTAYLRDGGPADALRRVLLHNAGVSRHLCRGAHLMRAGMRALPVGPVKDAPPTADRCTGALVYCRGNPQALAVGLLLPEGPPTAGSDGARTGVGVYIVHCYGDDLWREQSVDAKAEGSVNPLIGAAGTPFDAGHYGNAGFINGTHVVPIIDGAPEAEEDEFEVVTMDEVEPQTDELDLNSVPITIEDSLDAPVVTDDAGTTMTPDDVLHQAVCKALATLSVKRDLPMTLANFYAMHVIPNRPEGSLIELKQTKWKKFGAYVTEQVASGLLVVGPDQAKKDPMAMLININARASAEVQLYREQCKSINVDKNVDTKLVVMDLYIVPPHFVSLLQLDPEQVKAAHATSEERRHTGMLTLKEVRALLEGYIEAEALVAVDSLGTVHLNGPLIDALYGKQKKFDAPALLPRKDLIRLWQSKMQPAYALVETPGSRVARIGRGRPPTIQVVVSQRQKNKFETRIRGLEEFGIHAPSFQTDVSHRFACSGSIEEEPAIPTTKKDHVELLFQGNLATELEALLLGEPGLTAHGGAQNSPYRVPKGLVEVTRRKGVPAAKKPVAVAKKK